MRRPVKVKAFSTRVPLRKAAAAAAPAAERKAFPAWIAADEGAVAFPAKRPVTPRVRDALVLRTVSKKKSSGGKGSNHASGAR